MDENIFEEIMQTRTEKKRSIPLKQHGSTRLFDKLTAQGEKSMNYNLSQAIAIGIIGGADGPTSLYVSGMSARKLALLAILFATVFGLSLFGLIRGIKKRSQAKIIFFALVSALLAFVLFAPVAAGIYQYASLKRMSPFIELQAESTFSETEDSLGLSVVANDYDYFFTENKIINVSDDWAGAGFLVKEKLGENEYKIAAEYP